MLIAEYLILMRPKHWIKNLFIFLPIFFSGNISNLNLFSFTFFGFISFSLIASSIYCFNDINDIDFDKLHPIKKNRPIARGSISIMNAFIFMILLFILAFISSVIFFGINLNSVTSIILFYFLLNIIYSKWLKAVVIIDVLIIAIGFILRLMAGSFATGIILSKWIIILTFLLSLFLGFSKRLDDVKYFESDKIKLRGNLSGYNSIFLNQIISILASVILISYIMYTVSFESVKKNSINYLYTTSLFVLLGIFRYFKIIYVDKGGGNPVKILFDDIFIQLCILGWIITFIFLLYV